MPNNFNLLCRRRRKSYKWGYINTYLRSQVCSIHSLTYKIFFSSSGLMNILVSWFSVSTFLIEMSHFCWWSLMKWWQNINVAVGRAVMRRSQTAAAAGFDGGNDWMTEQTPNVNGLEAQWTLWLTPLKKEIVAHASCTQKIILGWRKLVL
jgi:hypothetical protein